MSEEQAMNERRGTDAQRSLLDQWVTALARLPTIEVIWLEGSLVDGRANPWSDIDLRAAVADAAYEELWEQRSVFLEGIGDYLLLWNKGFLRALTAGGVLVELAVRRSSELDAQELYEWKILLNRLPEGPPAFRELPLRSVAETWPGTPVTPADVRNRTLFIIHNMAIVGQDFHNGEVCAQAYTLDYLRSELFQVMYQRLGIRMGKRNKELSRIFPPEFIADLKSTYTGDGQSALDPGAMAAAQLRTLAALGKHLQALGEQVGSGFERVWFDRMYRQVRKDLGRWIG
jgi:hypothetical protein